MGIRLPEMLGSILAHLGEVNWITLVIGVVATAFLFWVRKSLKPTLRRFGVPPLLADVLTKAGPVAAVVATTVAVWAFGLSERGVKHRGRGAAKPAAPDLAGFHAGSSERASCPRDPDFDHRFR